MVPSAYLRLFQPLDAFERDERQHWQRYLELPPPLRRPVYADRQTGDHTGLLAPAGGEHAQVRIVDGRTYLAPERMRMRVLAAMLAFRREEPLENWESFISNREARRARRELGKHRRRDPHAVAFVHQSPWHVPIRWFVMFKADERTLADDEHGRLRLRYSTTTKRAMRRLGIAIPILRRSDLGPLGEMLVELHQWMGQFDSHSLVELDYGELCDSMTWDELDDDHSVADVQSALDALARYEVGVAADVYQGVLGRWFEIRGREQLN
jgi:hypothetical protein